MDRGMLLTEAKAKICVQTMHVAVNTLLCRGDLPALKLPEAVDVGHQPIPGMTLPLTFYLQFYVEMS
jgi:hypothetical protein